VNLNLSFAVNGAVHDCDEPLREDSIYQSSQLCSDEQLQKYCMQQVTGISFQLPTCTMKETNATVTGMLPRITSVNKYLRSSLNVKCFDTYTPGLTDGEKVIRFLNLYLF